MKSTHFKYCFLVFVLLAVSVPFYAQNAQDAYLDSKIQERKFAKENWEKAIEGIEYNEKRKQKEEDYDIDYSDSLSVAPTRSSRSYTGGSGNGAFWAGFFKVLFILIAIAAIAFIVYQFWGAGIFNGPKNRRIKRTDTAITIENIEEHFHESDLDRFIREATEQGKYALAIRLYYLAIIKELSLNKIILWKKDKTNKDYIGEMRNSNMFQSFREATSIFERVWYGEGDLEEEDYKEVKPKFEALVNAAKLPQGSIAID